MPNHKPAWVVPIGTQIVTSVAVQGTNIPQGTVGIIVKSPPDNSHAYHIRFLDGQEAMLMKETFTIKRHFQNLDIELGDVDLYQYVIFRCVVGSRAYGLDEPASDIDRRGIYLPPADLQWSLHGVPEQLENDTTQECYWEFQKFITLALKANPNILECLYTPLVEEATPIAQELLEARDIFLSKLVYQTYNGYVMSQFRKLKKDIENYGEIRWKHAMHLIRLLLSGIQVLATGTLSVEVSTYRDQLLAIRRGEADWEDIDQWRLALHKEFDEAFARTPLPDRPNYERANALLIQARRSVL